MNEFAYKLSLVVPCYNEEETVVPLYEEVDSVMKAHDINYEMVFVNDGSSDKTYELLKGITERADSHIRVIDFSRNFGKEAGIYAGLNNVQGEYTVIMDGDMQQSPDVVLEMLGILENDPEYDCVAAVQETRREGCVLSFFKNSFYKIINKTSSVDFVSGASDFRLMRRPVVDAILGMSEYYRFSKGIFAFVGFKTKFIPYVARARGGGKTKWSFMGLFRYAMDGIIGFTTAPLKITTFLGGAISVCAFVYLAWVVIDKLLHGGDVPGYPTIVSLILLLGGIQLMALGIIGEYLGRNYMESKHRPIYIERRRLDSDSSDKDGE